MISFTTVKVAGMKSIRSFFSVFVCSVFLFAYAVESYAAFAEYVLKPESSRIEIFFESTLHDVQGQATGLSGKVEFDPATGSVQTMPAVVIEVKSLTTFHQSRDRAMYEMFQIETFPEIRWEAEKMECPPVHEQGPVVCRAAGPLTIRDVIRTVSFDVMMTKIAEGKFKASAAVELSLKSFQLKPPSILGIIRVDDTVHLRVDSIWTRGETA